MNTLAQYFDLEAQGSTVGTEVRAGLVTFLTMSYILFVNPQILSDAGMPANEVAFATAVASAIACLVMGLWANFPFALAPGMGLNAYFTYGVVLGMGVDWPVALTAVFLEGIVFLLFALGGIRRTMIEAIPDAVKFSTTAGIGLFLSIIGLQNANIVVNSDATLVTLGDMNSATVLMALAGLVLISVLMVLKIQGAILIGIIAMTVVAWIFGLSKVPTHFVSIPQLPEQTMGALQFDQLFTPPVIMAMIAFLFVDIFDTAGSLLGVGRIGGFLDDQGNLPRAQQAFTSDATGTIVGSLLGTSTITFYIESAAGVEEGGRTGLTAVVVAAMFLLALFFTPLFTAVPSLATAPALVVVGAFMMRGVTDLDWSTMDEAIPAFLTITMMPFTYSIANGIAFGIVSYVLIKLVSGKPGEVHWVMYVLSVLLAGVYWWGLVA